MTSIRQRIPPTKVAPIDPISITNVYGPRFDMDRLMSSKKESTYRRPQVDPTMINVETTKPAIN